MLLTRKTEGRAEPRNPLARAVSALASKTVDRRAFLKGSGITVGAAAFASQLPLNMIGEAKAQAAAKGKIEVKRSVCTHCSVGCSVDAWVQDGVWVRQEPVFDSPLNLGAHCAKGASVREHGMTEHSHRLKYPMKLEGGKYRRISWETAINEIGDKLLAIRKESGPDATFWIGSSKHNNEQAYMFRKFVSMFGTNNMDHQARICHSTTVAGVANTWGYGAMTNSYNDLQNSKAMFFIGSNAAEAHPVSMLHALHAKENGAKMIVADPRFTRTASKADQYIRFRSGTDVALLWGMLYYIFENKWEDTKYINDRVYGMEKVREEVKKWTPDKVTEVTGVSAGDVYQAAETMAKNKPATIVWCMGQTQHSIGNAFVRASCILQLALGNIGVAGGGANIYRGHDNVQGATDIGPNPDSLPGYYGIATGSWKHWCTVWGVDYEWMKKQFASQVMMEKSGMTVSRWIDGVLEKNDLIDQDSNLRAIIYWGHAPNSQTRGLEMKQAMEKVDLMVIVDPYPTAAAAMPDRKDGVYLLPAATQFETSGSVTASNRSIQWREKIIEPLFESKPDHTIMYAFAKKFGFAEQFIGKNIKLVKDKTGWDEPLIEDITREFNKGTWTIGYTGQSPERLKAHMRLMQYFDVKTLRCTESVIDKETGYDIKGDYFGLPWPCYGTPEVKHPGSPVLYRTDLKMMDGGGCFRANFGVSKDGVNLLAEDGSHSKDSDITTGFPEFDHVLMKKLGWWAELTPAEQAAAEGKNWKTDLSGGIQRVCMVNHNVHFWGNAKARAVVWNFPDAVPLHREPLYSPRPDLVAKYPTHEDKKAFWRLPTLYKTVQQKAVADKVHEKYPIVLTSGRLVEYEGGGDETRSNPWLAELQQENFVEVNTKDAETRGIKYWDHVWVSTPTGARIKVRALVTERVGPGTGFIPFHFAGWWQGKDLLDKYPEGSAPIVRGEAVNTATTYGYDSVTMMQESKTTLCNIERA
jgi:formate dehydrogenase major subunit